MKSINTQSEVAEIELIYKPKIDVLNAPRVLSSESAYRVFKKVWDENKIQFIKSFKVILLNRGNKVLGVVDISAGGTAGTYVDAKLVFAAALKSNCQSIILGHNHPSGNLLPSTHDEGLTKRLVQIGRLLDLPILDHIILTSEGYCSFADEGKL